MKFSPAAPSNLHCGIAGFSGCDRVALCHKTFLIVLNYSKIQGLHQNNEYGKSCLQFITEYGWLVASERLSLWHTKSRGTESVSERPSALSFHKNDAGLLSHVPALHRFCHTQMAQPNINSSTANTITNANPHIT